MRILIINALARRVGGIESYLEGVVPALRARGHEVALGHQHDGPVERAALPVADGARFDFGADAAGAARAARDWRPDVVFAHGIEQGAMLARLRGAAPVVQFVHDYVGSCISGTKTHQSVPKPCGRPLGWGCLAHYYPHRCGGLDPRTMWRDFARQRRVREHVRSSDAVVVASSHMAREMLREGVPAERLHQPAFFVPAVERAAAGAHPPLTGAPPSVDTGAARLLFAGRMDAIKGGAMLLDALPGVAQALSRDMELTVLGDGPARAHWEAVAARVAGAHSRVRVVFAGWTDALASHLSRTDALVVPSIWPEPFGMVGPEAGVHGVPAVAFAVGGIPEWLTDGVNGCLAPGDRPTADGLRDAIVRVFASPARHDALRAGARRLALRFRLDPHIDALERILDATAARSPRAEPPPVAR